MCCASPPAASRKDLLKVRHNKRERVQTMKRITAVAAMVGITAALSGCKPDAETTAELQSLRKIVTEQAKTLNRIEDARSKLTSDVEKLQSEVLNLQIENALMSGAGETATLSVTEKGYSVAEMDIGSVLLSVKDVAPYANGVKVKLNIGNPTSATFPGLKLNVVWANAAPGTKNYDPNTRQTKEITISGEIKPGMWNTEEIVLAPAKPDQIDYVTIKPSAPRVILRTSTERK